MTDIDAGHVEYFKSWILGRAVYFDELYTMPAKELDLIIAECRAVRADAKTPDRLRKRQLMAGYFAELGALIAERRLKS